MAVVSFYHQVLKRIFLCRIFLGVYFKTGYALKKRFFFFLLEFILTDFDFESTFQKVSQSIQFFNIPLIEHTLF